jgi:hypothetical protein
MRTRSLTFVAILSSVVAISWGGLRSLDGGNPIQFGMEPSVAAAGQSVTLSVNMGNITSYPRQVGISSTTASKFSTLPTTIVVPAGSLIGTGSATVAPSASGGLHIKAGSGNGMQIVSEIMVNPN